MIYMVHENYFSVQRGKNQIKFQIEHFNPPPLQPQTPQKEEEEEEEEEEEKLARNPPLPPINFSINFCSCPSHYHHHYHH